MPLVVSETDGVATKTSWVLPSVIGGLAGGGFEIGEEATEVRDIARCVSRGERGGYSAAELTGGGEGDFWTR